MIAIDMEMPENCKKCIFLNDDYDYPECKITGETKGYTFNTRTKRMPKCPLKEINKNNRIVRPKSLGFTIIGDKI